MKRLQATVYGFWTGVIIWLISAAPKDALINAGIGVLLSILIILSVWIVIQDD